LNSLLIKRNIITQQIVVFQPSGSSSRPQKNRGKNKKLEGRITITEIAEDGEPIAPANAKTKLVNQNGFLVRDNIFTWNDFSLGVVWCTCTP